MRVVFMGTPEFAVPTLQALLAEHDVRLVVSRPDRPAGRGMAMRRSPAAAAADAAGVPVALPARVRDPSLAKAIRAVDPEVIVVAAFGQILPAVLLSLAPHGAINVHASLLPRWRGASPIAAAILAGDAETGVSIMRMDEGLDTGPVMLQVGTPIGDRETTGELTERLARLSAEALGDALGRLVRGEVDYTPQPADGVTVAPLVRKTDGDLDWTLAAAAIERAVRAYNPWPGVRLPLAGEPVRVLQASAPPAWAARNAVDAVGATSRAPGEIVETGPEGITVWAADGPVRLEQLQAPGKKAMGAAEYARGRRDIRVSDG